MTKEELVFHNWTETKNGWINPKVAAKSGTHYIYFCSTSKAIEFEKNNMKPFENLVEFLNWVYGLEAK